jgi:hypothetical protein
MSKPKKPRSTSAESYQHRTAQSPNRPDVGTQAAAVGLQVMRLSRPDAFVRVGNERWCHAQSEICHEHPLCHP